MTEKKLTCISCPKGCELTVILDGRKIQSVTGNACKKGLAYAKNEIEDPKRMLTTTVKLKNGTHLLVPVKSRSPLPKDLLLDCMKEINNTAADAPIHIGSVVMHDILHSGVDIIATKTVLHK